MDVGRPPHTPSARPGGENRLADRRCALTYWCCWRPEGAAMARIWPGRRRRDGEAEASADELAAELSAAYWEAYAERMASVGFLAMARQFPSLIGQAMRLGWE